jgi:hypothetical protein
VEIEVASRLRMARTRRRSAGRTTVAPSSNFKLAIDIENPQTLVPGASAAVTVKVTNSSTANGKIKVHQREPVAAGHAAGHL